MKKKLSALMASVAVVSALGLAPQSAAAEEPSIMSFEPSFATEILPAEICTILTVADADGVGLEGVEVDVVSEGVAPTQFTAITGPGGSTDMCFQPIRDGFTLVTATAGALTATAEFDWFNAPPENHDPVARFFDVSPVNEGEESVLDASASYDEDGDILSFEWDTDRDGAYDNGNDSGLVITYPVAGEYTAAVRVLDGRGGLDGNVVTALVVNVEPTVSINTDLDQGHLTGSGFFVDPGQDTWTATVDYGDGNGPVPLRLDGKDFALDHEYTTPGAREVIVAVSDTIGSSTGTTTATVTVLTPTPTPTPTPTATPTPTPTPTPTATPTSTPTARDC